MDFPMIISWKWKWINSNWKINIKKLQPYIQHFWYMYFIFSQKRLYWLIDLVKLRYSFNVHAWLPLCVAIRVSIVKNLDAPSKCWKEVSLMVTKRLYSMWLLPRSNAMINHGIRALIRGLWVWQWISWCVTCFVISSRMWH